MSTALLELILRHNKLRVPLAELKRLFQETHPESAASPNRHGELLTTLRQLAEQGDIKLPAPASWEQRGNPPLPSWVQRIVAKPEPEFDYATIAWVPEMGFWPMLKPAQLAPARVINAFLLRRRGSLSLVPLKERSLELFGDEKYLDTLRKADAIFGGQLPLATIGAFQVPLPLPYRKANAPGKPLLIVENHDSYWSFGEWNDSHQQYAAIVFGSGLAIHSASRSLHQVLTETAGVGIEYLGDLDPAGITIPVTLNLIQAPTSLSVKPANRFYAWLLKHGTRRVLEQNSDAALARATSWLPMDISEGVIKLWQEKLWIPQESLGIEMLTRDFGRSVNPL